MTEKYAIIDNANGHLVNTVLWDGDTSKWQPPNGTNAVKLSDLGSLPSAPLPEVEKFTPEAWTSQHFTAAQILALQRFEFALQQADKPLGQNIAALKQWLETMLLASADPTPRSDWSQPPCVYAVAAGEAVAALQS